MTGPSLTEWRHAVTVGEVATIQAGVQQHPAMTPSPDWPHHSALVASLRLHAPRLTRSLLRAAAARGEDLDVPDAQGRTVLDRVLAFQYEAGVEPGSDADLVPWLLVSGAHPHASQFWRTIVEGNDLAYLRACLKAYPSCHSLLQASEGPANPLHQAVVLGPEDQAASLVRRLLRAGVDPHGRDAQGLTPWMKVVDPAVLAEAISAQVSLDAVDEKGWTVLHHLINRPDGRLDAHAHVRRVREVLQAAPHLVQQGDVIGVWLDAWPATDGLRQAHLALLEVLSQAGLNWSSVQRDQFLALPGVPEEQLLRVEAHWRSTDRQTQLQARPPEAANRPRHRV